MIQKLRPHPFEQEVDRLIRSLEGTLSEIKNNFDSGVLYNFLFAEIPCYLALPLYVPSRNDNLIRIEFTVGRLPLEVVAQILFKVGLDFDMNRHCVLRLVPRTKNHKVYELILQVVANADLVQAGFVSGTILYGLELAQYYRDEFLNQSNAG